MKKFEVTLTFMLHEGELRIVAPVHEMPEQEGGVVMASQLRSAPLNGDGQHDMIQASNFSSELARNLMERFEPSLVIPYKEIDRPFGKACVPDHETHEARKMEWAEKFKTFKP